MCAVWEGDGVCCVRCVGRRLCALCGKETMCAVWEGDCVCCGKEPPLALRQVNCVNV